MINLEKLNGIEKLIAEKFLQQFPNPICINIDCEKEAVNFKFTIENKKESEYAKVKIDSFCKKHFIEKKLDELKN